MPRQGMLMRGHGEGAAGRWWQASTRSGVVPVKVCRRVVCSALMLLTLKFGTSQDDFLLYFLFFFR